jgi:hypothetical protein
MGSSAFDWNKRRETGRHMGGAYDPRHSLPLVAINTGRHCPG